MGTSQSVSRVDLSGKVAVVTGANTGLGYEVAKSLASMGAHTVVACRSEEKAKEAIARMREEDIEENPLDYVDSVRKELKLEFMTLDLASFQSARQFADDFKSKGLPLHILVNNAGIAMVAKGLTGDGYESHFQVNYLSPLLLTLELLQCLLNTASSTGDGRIVFVCSSSHKTGTLDPSNMNGEVSYNRFSFYGNSKLYQMMSAFSLQRRVMGSGVTVSLVHPGLVGTDIYRGIAGQSAVLNVIGRAATATPLFRDVKTGAATILDCAVNPKLKSQVCDYFVDFQPHPLNNPIASVKAQQEELWASSVDILKDFLSTAVRERYGYGGSHADLADQSDPSEPSGDPGDIATS